MKTLKVLLLTLLTIGLFSGCGLKGMSDINDDLNTANGENCSNPDGIHCKAVMAHSTFIEDSFERDDVIDNSIPAQLFGWRKIINDNGKIIDGASGNHVDMQIYDDTQMGTASHGNRALYSFGRMGSSVHNIYLISRTFEIDKLVDGNTAIIEFDYLTVNLDKANEYIRLEVCNDTAENCGVGSQLTMAGLNDPGKWSVVFEQGPDPATVNLDGKNHVLADWKSKKVVMFLEDFQKREFIFRFNGRMDEGFHRNNPMNTMVDGVAIDRVRATAYKIDDDIVDDVEEPEDILDLDDDDIINDDNY